MSAQSGSRSAGAGKLPRLIFAAAAVALIAIVTTAAIVLISDSDSAVDTIDSQDVMPNGSAGGAGGGGEPPPPLVTALRGLPSYPDAVLVDTVHRNGVSKGSDLRIGYRVRAPISEVIGFYQTALQRLGWAPDGEPVDTSASKYPAEFHGLSQTFHKGNLALTVSASTSNKDPADTSTGLNLRLETR